MFVVFVLRLQQYFHPVHRGYRRLRHHARDSWKAEKVRERWYFNSLEIPRGKAPDICLNKCYILLQSVVLINYSYISFKNIKQYYTSRRKPLIQHLLSNYRAKIQLQGVVGERGGKCQASIVDRRGSEKEEQRKKALLAAAGEDDDAKGGFHIRRPQIFLIFWLPLLFVTYINQLILFLSSAFRGPPHLLRTSYMEAPKARRSGRKTSDLFSQGMNSGTAH